MVLHERIEIIKLFLSVVAGLAAGGVISPVTGDPLTTLLVSVSAIVITYYILCFLENVLSAKKE